MLLKQGSIQTRRGSKRCGNDEGEKSVKTFQPVAQTVFALFERAGEDEPNCSEVMVSPDMKPDDVAKIVLEKVNVKGEDSHL